MFRFLSTELDRILWTLFYPECPVCFTPSQPGGTCKGCLVVVPIQGPLCSDCGLPIKSSEIRCGACCILTKQFLQGAQSLLWLTEDSRKLIHLIKYEKRFEWLRLFKQIILTAQPPIGFEDAIVIPVPTHPKRFFERGFNQSEIIARQLATQWKMPLNLGLKKIVQTLPQSQLNRGRRTENLIGCFSWNQKKIPSKVIVVDDILTTGETLYSCARALKNKGVESVFGWTLFRTIPRDVS